MKKSVKNVEAKKTSKTTQKSRGTNIFVPPVVTQVNAIQCTKCLDIIYSCAVHDFKQCSCGACFIDGGFDYTRIGGNSEDMHSFLLSVPASKKDLYDDWNRLSPPHQRMFGCIKLSSPVSLLS